MSEPVYDLCDETLRNLFELIVSGSCKEILGNKSLMEALGFIVSKLAFLFARVRDGIRYRKQKIGPFIRRFKCLLETIENKLERTYNMFPRKDFPIIVAAIEKGVLVAIAFLDVAIEQDRKDSLYYAELKMWLMQTLFLVNPRSRKCIYPEIVDYFRANLQLNQYRIGEIDDIMTSFHHQSHSIELECEDDEEAIEGGVVAVRFTRMVTKARYDDSF